METLRLARATHQLLERGIAGLEKIGRELERYNHQQEYKRQRGCYRTFPLQCCFRPFLQRMQREVGVRIEVDVHGK
jgi:hypothetical protein